MMRRTNIIRFAIIFILSLALSTGSAFGATHRGKKRGAKSSRTVAAQVKQVNKAKGKRVRTARSVRRTRHSRLRASFNGATPRGGHPAGGPWLAPTFADSTAGDNVDGEELTVRRAAVDALGPYNGSVVVVDPTTGRILTMVNQKLALSDGYQPCSTVKVMASLAGLAEGVIPHDNYMRITNRWGMNLSNALALSNNTFFATVGTRLGYDKVNYYGRLFGYGERAGLNIEGERPGLWPDAPPANGGMGMMTSFGEGIGQTPLQLAALVSAVANGGTLYYLQYPKTQAEADHLVPRIKRQLPIQGVVDQLKAGMSGAVTFGTARRAFYDPSEPIFGKTGTCTDSRTPTHLGWFGSYNEVNGRKLVVVVMLTGGRPVNGPVASGIAGQIYRTLSQAKFFNRSRTITPMALVSGSSW